MMIPFLSSMIVSWSMLNTIPSVLLGAPDESALFTVLPGQKYLMSGRGFEGVMVTGVGGLAGLYFLLLVVAPVAQRALPVMQTVLRPHMHWILWVIITFMLMSEWPKTGHGGREGWGKFFAAWKTLGTGLATFLLSGLFGFLILYRSPVSVEVAFQNIMPAFVGLFAVPWCLLNVLSGTEVPPQRIDSELEIDADVILRSAASGALGGGFAAFFPIITGGVGGMLAGHATAQRDERVFIMSQGVSKLIYYSGAFMLFFVPGLGLRRGGGAWLMQGLYTPRTQHDFLLVLASIAISGAVAFLMMPFCTRLVIRLIERINYRAVSILSLAVILAMVLGITGWRGLAVMLVGTGIGLLPVLFGSRRLNCLGVLLLPMACNMSGFGQNIAQFLGLI
jgi:putative membrane protein